MFTEKLPEQVCLFCGCSPWRGWDEGGHLHWPWKHFQHAQLTLSCCARMLCVMHVQQFWGFPHCARMSVPKTRRNELPEVPALRKACVLQIARRDRQQLKVYSWKCQIMPGDFIHDWLRYVVWCFLRRAQVMWCWDTVKLTLKSCSNHHIFILWWQWHFLVTLIYWLIHLFIYLK